MSVFAFFFASVWSLSVSLFCDKEKKKQADFGSWENDMKTLKQDQLSVQIHDSRDAMGKAAAADVAACIHKLLAEKEEISMIFAAAPSQNEVLFYLHLHLHN